jgi:hypothetical protein
MGCNVALKLGSQSPRKQKLMIAASITNPDDLQL